jgi:hypothetical protein
MGQVVSYCGKLTPNGNWWSSGVTNETAEVGAKEAAETVIGVDINEDCVALGALTE